MTDDFLATHHRAQRTRPPIVLHSADNKAAYAMRANPPPSWAPKPVALPVAIPAPPPPPVSQQTSAAWPKLHAALMALARDGAPLPQMPELAVLLGVCRTTLSQAFDHLATYGYIARDMHRKQNRPAEMRVMIIETGAVVQTAGWETRPAGNPSPSAT